MTDTLIATLGTVPGTVTATYEALYKTRRDLNHFDKVVFLGTLHRDVIDARTIVEEEMRNRYGNGLPEFIDENFPDEDVNTAPGFHKWVSDAIERYVETEDRLWISVTGGRKTMSAITAIVAQIYPNVQGIHHTWVHPDIERRAATTRSRRSENVLFPSLEPNDNQCRLVTLPYFALSDYREHFLAEQIPSYNLGDYLKGERYNETTARQVLNAMPRRLSPELSHDFVGQLQVLFQRPQEDDLVNTIKSILGILEEAGIIIDYGRLMYALDTAQEADDPAPTLDQFVDYLVAESRDNRPFAWARKLQEGFFSRQNREALGTVADLMQVASGLSLVSGQFFGVLAETYLHIVNLTDLISSSGN